MKKECISLKIESVAFGGDGVGRRDGLVIFVPFTAPGDVAEVEITHRKKNFARGRLLKIITPSPLRTDPLCRYYGSCGGCTYQHIRYDHQLEIKRKQVEDAFLKIGGIRTPNVNAVIASPRFYAYRGKATLHAQKTRAGLKLGFMDISGGALADIAQCEIMHETINDQIRQIRSEGIIRSGKEDITLWSGGQNRSDETVIRTVCGREFLVPYDGFFQANLYLTDCMVAEVLRLVDSEKRGTVVDACCGCGLFSLFLAPHASKIIGVEINEKSVHFAKLNVERQGVNNAEFICGDVSEVLHRLAQTQEKVDMMVLDPPRTGLESETVDAILEIQPSDIVYISCNPATQARDVRRFREAGFDLYQIQPLDMFAQTEHIETICLLKRTPGA